MYQILSQLSDPCTCIPSEDVTGYVQRDDRFKAWAIDGGSYLTERPFTTFSDCSDAHWFATELSNLLADDLRDDSFNANRLHVGLDALRRRYVSLAPSTPIWAYPVAACTIIELQRLDEHIIADIYQYADCFALFGRGNPSYVSEAPTEFHSISSAIHWRPFSGFSGEQLTSLRDRRIEQQENKNTTALTLNAESAANCTHVREILDVPCQVLIGTDGLSRAWELYRLLETDSVIDFISKQGLHALFRRLRCHEDGQDQARPKSRDDAAALHIQCA